MPLLDKPRSCWMVGAAIGTMVWSMNVIATAKIIAVRTRPFDRTPFPVVGMALIVLLLDQDGRCHGQRRGRHGPAPCHSQAADEWLKSPLTRTEPRRGSARPARH